MNEITTTIPSRTITCNTDRGPVELQTPEITKSAPVLFSPKYRIDEDAITDRAIRAFNQRNAREGFQPTQPSKTSGYYPEHGAVILHNCNGILAVYAYSPVMDRLTYVADHGLTIGAAGSIVRGAE